MRRFIGLPEDHLLVLGARHTPPVPLPTPNAQAPNSAIQVLTSVGFRHVIAKDYVEATSILQPDIIVGPGDIPVDTKQISRKKKVKITDRTTRWMQEQVQYRRDKEGTGLGQPALFAPLLPLEVEAQSDYIGHIVDEMTDQVQGLAVYDTCSLKGLPSALETLPKMSFTDPASPHTLLREIAQGLDIFTVPFIGAVTDAGIALDFSFPVKAGQTESQELKPLGVDMWPSTFAADLSPLREGCPCYACTNHHKAYLQHLLSAKEMLGWVLLQIHNHCVMDEFFAGVRDSISQGSFEEDTEAFARMYEAELPEKTGQGPRYVFDFGAEARMLTEARVRGYQFKAEGPDEPKKNPTAYRKLDDAKEKLAEAVLPSPNADAGDLEALGFAEQTSNTDGR